MKTKAVDAEEKSHSCSAERLTRALDRNRTYVQSICLELLPLRRDS